SVGIPDAQVREKLLEQSRVSFQKLDLWETLRQVSRDGEAAIFGQASRCSEERRPDAVRGVWAQARPARCRPRMVTRPLACGGPRLRSPGLRKSEQFVEDSGTEIGPFDQGPA